MNVFSHIFTLLVSIILAVNAFAAGVTDRGFGVNGNATTSVLAQSRVVDVISYDDGRWLIVLGRDQPNFQLVRYLSNGSLDQTFGTNGIATVNTNLRVVDAELLGNGRVLVAGSLFYDNGSSDFAVMKFVPDGTIDQAFANSGIATVNQGINDNINKIDVQNDGKIVFAGHTTDAGGAEAVGRLTDIGSLDVGFGSGGLFLRNFAPTLPNGNFYSQFSDIKVMPNGSILVGLSRFFGQAGVTQAGAVFIMLNESGSYDTSFGNGGGGIGFLRYLGTSGGGPVGFDVFPNGNICVTYITGISIVAPNGNVIRDLPFEGGRVQAFGVDRVLVSNDSRSVGRIRTYNERNLIGRSSVEGMPAIAEDGRLVTARVDTSTSSLIVKGYRRLNSQGTRLADFDRDDRTDLAIQRGSTFISRNSSGSNLNFSLPVGAQIIPDQGSFFVPLMLPSTSFTDQSALPFAVRGLAGSTTGKFGLTSTTGTVYYTGQWGLPGDIPIGGDFDGNGLIDRTVFRPSNGTWYSSNWVRWGTAGDKPVPADYDYDGITDFAVYRPSTGTWWVLKSSGGSFAFSFGLPTDIPLTGDYDGDGYADFTVYRASEGNWYQQLTTEGFRVTRFGLPEDKPVPGDYDGDGRHDIALYRAGVWYLLKSTEGFAAVTMPNILPTDVPVSVRFDE